MEQELQKTVIKMVPWARRDESAVEQVVWVVESL